MDCYKFGEKLKGFAERKFDNEKDMLCMVTEMEDLIKVFKEENTPENLNEDAEYSTLKKKRLYLALIRYMDG